MNDPFALSLGLRTIALLALEVALVVVIAAALDNRRWAPLWRRSVWQIALLSLFVILAAELSGLGRTVSGWAFLERRPVLPQQPALNASVVEVEPTHLVAPEHRASDAPMGVEVSSDRSSKVFFVGLNGAWAVGVFAMLTWIALGRFRLGRWRRRCSPLTDEALLEMTRSLSARLKLRRPVRLWESPDLAGPVAFGLVYPQLALPIGFAVDFAKAEQEAILAHEIAHLAAYDPHWHLLADLAVALLWWHPMSWVARRRFQFVSECAADQASALFPDGPERLAECLVKMGRRLAALPEPWRLKAVGNGFRSALGQRVARLLDRRRQEGMPFEHGGLGLCSRIVGPCALSFAVIAGVWSPANSAPATLRQAWETSPAGLMLAQLAPSTSAAAAAPVRNSSTSPEQKSTGETRLPEPILPTRWIRVDSAMFLTRLQEMVVLSGLQEKPIEATTPAGMHQTIRAAFHAMGMSLEPPRSIFYNDRVGMLMLRFPREEMELVENLIGMLAERPQVTIEVEMVKVSSDEISQLQLDKYKLSPHARPQTPQKSAFRQRQIEWKAVLTHPQFAAMWSALGQRKEIERVPFPKVTTLSERQAQISSGQGARGSADLVIDLVPVVGRDGYTIDLTAIVMTPEVIGYDLEPVHLYAAEPAPPPQSMMAPSALYAQAIAGGRIWDGQTMVVATGPGKNPMDPKDQRRWLFFITTTVIDPAGRRVFNEEELKFAKEWIPPQP